MPQDVFDEIESPATSDVFDEIAPEKKDVFDEIEGGNPVVREVQPGSIPPTDLFPAIRKIGGEIVPGQIGDTHPDIIRREGIAATDIDQRGFTTPWGDFLDREAAAQGTQLPTAFEPGRLHSTDLSKFQEGLGKPLEEAAAAEAPQPFVKLPEPSSRPSPIAYAPVKAVFGQKGVDVTKSVFDTVYNTAKSVPEFLQTEEGMLAMLASATPLGRAGVEAYFTGDMLKSLWDQAKSGVKDWDSLSTAQKAGRITQAIATLGFTGFLARAGIGTIKQAIKKPASLLAPTVPEPTSKPEEVTPATVQAPADIAKELGVEPVGTSMGRDHYQFPTGKTEAGMEMDRVQVPAGSSIDVVRDAIEKRKAQVAKDFAKEEPPTKVPVEYDPIIAAAYKTPDGKVISGLDGKDFQGVTHMEAYMAAEEMGIPVDESMAGFITRSGKFLDRNQAFNHAEKTKQLEQLSDTFEEGKLHTGKITEYASPIKEVQPKPEVATLATGEAKNHLGDPLGTTYRATPEDWSAWQSLQGKNLTEEGVFAERERIKNKYGGMPPEPPSAPTPVEPAPAPPLQEGRFRLKLEPDRIDAVIEGDKGNLVVRAPAGTDAEGRYVVDSLTVFVERGLLENTFGGTPIQHVTLSKKFTGKTAQEARNKAYKAFADQINKEGFGEQARPAVAQLPAPVAQEPSPKPPTERLLIKPRTDGLVSLEDTKGNRISTHKTVEEAAKTASDLGYGIAPGSPLKPKKTATPTIVGLGAAEKGEAAPGTQIEQLTQALKGVQEKRAPLVEQVKDAFSVGDRLSAAKDTVGKALSGMKAAGDMIISKWKGIPKIDDLLRAKKTLSRAIESRGWRLLKWEQQARKSVPNPRDQAAIAKWIDAGGDTATLQRGLAEAPDKFKQAYQDALNLSGDKLTTAQNVQNYFESRLQEAIDAGVLDHGIDNYIHRMYESKPDILKRSIAYTQTGLLKTNPALAKKRFFQFDWEAEKAGYTPVQSFIKRITAYEASLSKAIAAREFIKSASEMKASDGRPVIDIKGVGIPIEDPAGVYREATLIKPKFNPARNNDPQLPNGNPNPNYRGDYVNRDYRALSRWKWVGSDAGGKPIYVQGDVAIHPEYANRIDALLKPSQVRYGKYGSILRPALGVSSTIKQTMLDLSGFHPVQIAVHGMEHRVMPWSVIKDIDLSHPDVEGLLQGGVTLGGDYTGLHSEGLIGSSLTRRIPGLGPVMESYHQWLFQDFIPRIKMTMALHALERNRARYAGKLTEEQIFHKTASEANAAFGELNYTVLERSKTAQDMARLILLAPDFLEARARFAGQAFQRGGKAFGHEQRTALLLGALTMWVTARIANKMIDGQYHNEPENLFNIVKDGHAYGMRTVQGDLLHLLTKPMQFAMSRLNPVYARTLLEALTGRDYFGRKRTPAEQVWDAASTTIPISLRSNRERKLWESMLNGIGVTARRYSDVDDAFKLAQKWKDKNAVPERGEFIYDPNKDVLRPLKLALNHGDEVTAAKEIKALIDSKVYNLKKLDEYFKRFASMPFTGSKANDSKFIKSLTEDQRKTVEAARQHKNEIRKLYMKSRGQYLAPPSQL